MPANEALPRRYFYSITSGGMFEALIRGEHSRISRTADLSMNSMPFKHIEWVVAAHGLDGLYVNQSTKLLLAVPPIPLL